MLLRKKITHSDQIFKELSNKIKDSTIGLTGSNKTVPDSCKKIKIWSSTEEKAILILSEMRLIKSEKEAWELNNTLAKSITNMKQI